MPTHPKFCTVAYCVSALLDAVDGKAARALGQSSRFGAILDMVTDRYALFSFVRGEKRKGGRNGFLRSKKIRRFLLLRSCQRTYIRTDHITLPQMHDLVPPLLPRVGVPPPRPPLPVPHLARFLESLHPHVCVSQSVPSLSSVFVSSQGVEGRMKHFEVGY
jgi:hypothetical protein